MGPDKIWARSGSYSHDTAHFTSTFSKPTVGLAYEREYGGLRAIFQKLHSYFRVPVHSQTLPDALVSGVGKMMIKT